MKESFFIFLLVIGKQTFSQQLATDPHLEGASQDYQSSTIRGFSNFAIEGGAATILDMPLDEKKKLKNLVMKSIANDIVIGLMTITLEK